MTRMAVTGVTGAVGALVAQQLLQRGVEPLLLARDPGRIADWGRALESATCDYDDPSQSVTALQGVDVLFMVSGHEGPERMRQHERFIAAARGAGVGHVVYTSYFHAAPDAEFTLAREHWQTEQLLAASGMGFTALRDNMYLDFAPALVGEDGVIRGPAGQGRVAMVARADVAAVAATVMLAPDDHRGALLELTGPEELALDEVAALLSRAQGRPVRFHDETVPEAYTSRAGYGAPEWQLDAWVSTYTAIAAGQLAPATSVVADLLGRPATSLSDFLGLTVRG